MSKKTITHYPSKCIGCGSCVAVCPKYWKVSEKNGLAELIEGKEKNGVFVRQVDIEDEEANQLAADCCPANVIKIN